MLNGILLCLKNGLERGESLNVALTSKALGQVMWDSMLLSRYSMLLSSLPFSDVSEMQSILYPFSFRSNSGANVGRQ